MYLAHILKLIIKEFVVFSITKMDVPNLNILAAIFCLGLHKQTQLLCCGWWYLPWPSACLYSLRPSYSSSAAAAGEVLEGTRGVWLDFFRPDLSG